MKTALLILCLLAGCAAPDPRCVASCVTLPNVVKAADEAWQKGWDQGFDDGEDAADLRRLKAL